MNRTSSIHPVLYSAVWMVAVVIMSYLLGNKGSPGILYNVPKPILAIDMQARAEFPTTTNNPLVGTYDTARQNAFFAGITRADMDVIGNDNSEDSLALLAAVNGVLNKHLATEDGRYWIGQGYALQILYLVYTDKRTASDQSLLLSARKFYRKKAYLNSSRQSELLDVPRYWRLNNDLITIGNNPLAGISIQNTLDAVAEMKSILQVDQ